MVCFNYASKKWYINVKTDPNFSDLLRKTYSYIIPACHMNKEHWNTIVLAEEVDSELIKELIKQSYELTPKGGKHEFKSL